jgi:hypothetical protein
VPKTCGALELPPDRPDLPAAVESANSWGYSMSDIDLLRSSKRRLVGVKQTLKALEKEPVRVVFIAKDAEE